MTTTPPPKRPKGLILALGASLLGNAVLITVNRTVSMNLDLAKGATDRYKSAYRAIVDKDLMLTRDFTAMYVANVRQIEAGLRTGNLKDTLAGLDSANFFAGFLSRYTRDGQHFASADYAARIARGPAAPPDLAALQAEIDRMQARSEAVQKALAAQRDQEPGPSPSPVAH